MKKTLLLLIGMILLTTGVTWAAPWPIKYILTGNLTGDYTTGGFSIAFTDAPFTFQVVADAVAVTPVTTFNPKDLYAVGAHPYLSGSTVDGILSITGVGDFTFLNKLYAADSQANNLQPGIFELGTDFEGPVISVLDVSFSSYQMMTKVDPLTVGLQQAGYSQFAVSAGGITGDLVLSDASSLTFQAMGGVPEPSSCVLFCAGFAGLLLACRKPRRE